MRSLLLLLVLIGCVDFGTEVAVEPDASFAAEPSTAGSNTATSNGSTNSDEWEEF